jgi:hypothetical protein
MGPAGLAIGLGVLLGPALLLAAAGLRDGQGAAWWYFAAAGAEALAAVGFVLGYRTLTPPPTATGLATGGLAWLAVVLAPWVTGAAVGQDWFAYLLRGLLTLPLLAALAAFALQNSGALLIRQAQRLAQQVLAQASWPTDPAACRDLPLVKAFAAVVQFDATPALQLLTDPRPQVRFVALLPLEQRRYWRPGQIERVLAVLQRETVPEVKAAAIKTLYHLQEARFLEAVAEHLRDPSPLVRQATAVVVMRESKSKKRWGYVREGVRKALIDPGLVNDGSILPPGMKMHKDALEDFLGWSAQHGSMGTRACLSLISHHAHAMQERPDEMAPRLRQLALEESRATLLRTELARILCQRKLADASLLEQLIEPKNPTPLRLLAADTILQAGPSARVAACLRDLARMNNRELALATADVLQRRLGIDMGLAMGQPLPPINSTRAVEVQKRLMQWASRPDHAENVLDTRFPSTLPRDGE